MYLEGVGIEGMVEQQLEEFGYCVERTLGKGNFSMVYVVWKYEGEEKRYFACKVSRERELLRQEAIFLEQFRYEMFPKYKEYRETEEAGFLFQELITGRNLAEAVGNRGGFSAFQTAQIALSLAVGIKYLHDWQPSVLYLDIKPENVMVCQDGSVRLLDFGCCCYLEQQNRGCRGTLCFAAPEQLQWEEKAGKYSDVYGLGQLMKWMLRKPSVLKPQDKDRKAQEKYETAQEECGNNGKKSGRSEKVQKKHITASGKWERGRKRKQSRCERKGKQNKYEKRVQKVIAKATKELPEQRFQDMEGIIGALLGKKKRKRKCAAVRNVWEKQVK